MALYKKKQQNSLHCRKIVVTLHIETILHDDQPETDI